MHTSVFGPDFYEQKLQGLQQDLQADLVIIAPGELLGSLCGIKDSTHERFAALALTEQLRVGIFPQTDDTVVATSVLPELGVQVHYWRDGQNPYELLAQALGLDTLAVDYIGINADLRSDHLLALQLVYPAAAFHTVDAQLGIKLPAEIEQLRLVAAAIDTVHAQVPALLTPGRTEAEVAKDIEALILVDHVAVDFIIVGSGPNGAMPHHSYSGRKLQAGELVVVDLGGTNAAGYHSDCTRTYVVDGDPAAIDAQAAKAYEVLYEAQQRAVAAVRPGIAASEIDAIARDHITAAGFGEYFSHRTGHGIGVSTHEPPFIAADSSVILQPGMAFSVEPGIYVPGKWGMRIEDIVTVTDDGVAVLNHQPRELR